MRKLKTLALVGILFIGAISQTACGNTTTLDKVGRVAVALAQGFADQVRVLKDAGLDSKKIDTLDAASKKLNAAAKSLKEILDSGKTVNERDAVQIAAYVAVISTAVNSLLINPDFTGLGENSKIVKITKYTSIVLNQLSLTLAVFFPSPPPGAVLAADGGKSVATSQIKIEFAKPPAEVEALLK